MYKAIGKFTNDNVSKLKIYTRECKCSFRLEQNQFDRSTNHETLGKENTTITSYNKHEKIFLSPLPILNCFITIRYHNECSE